MKHVTVILTALALAPILALPMAQAQGKKVTITGTVVDTYCLVTMGMEGSDHRQCATQCAKNGSPLGITDDRTGALYLTVGQKDMVYASPRLERYVERKVTVHGTVYEKDGLKMIVVDSATPSK
jgi:hypothetical protein